LGEPQDTDWAYAAGFVDGEGCIAVVRSFEPKSGRYVYGVQVVVSNVDRTVLDWMQGIWGGWVVAVSQRQGRSRDSWTWRTSSQKAKPFLGGIRRWLRIKGRQCDNALAMIDLLQRSRRTLGPYPLPPAWLDEQEKLYWIQRQLNHRGTDAFEAKPMHSPRKIHRARLSESSNLCFLKGLISLALPPAKTAETIRFGRAKAASPAYDGHRMLGVILEEMRVYVVQEFGEPTWAR
jgi:hypothetical protein